MFVKKDKIKEMIKDKVLPLLGQELAKHGFEKSKSKSVNSYFRQKNGFIQYIDIGDCYDPFSMNDKDQVFINFYLDASIEIAGYEVWHLRTFGTKKKSSKRVERLLSRIELLSFAEFEQDDFYEPTENEKFKTLVSRSIGRLSDNEYIPFHELINERLPHTLELLDTNSNIIYIREHSEFPFQHIPELAFFGQLDLASIDLQARYNELIQIIEKKDSLLEDIIEVLDQLIDMGKKILPLNLVNPFSICVKLCENENKTIEVSPKTKFVEHLRFNISQFEILSTRVNPQGEVLLFTKSNRLMKFDGAGSLIIDMQLDPPKGFKLSLSPASGVVKGASLFHVNNYIVTSENKILELKLPKRKKSRELQSADIDDLAYCNNTGQYILIYQNELIWYNKEGDLEKSMKLPYEGGKIIAENQWIIMHNKEKELVICTLDGSIINTYPYAHANYRYTFSSNFENLICFNYSTKSQFYNLNNVKPATLWAHPTYMQGYIETLFKDVPHNFGMGIARFSPDNSYIIGGADYGRYVAWMMPKLERIELTPTVEAIGKLISTYMQDKGQKIEFVSIKKHTFIKPFLAEITNIFFFDNGDYFLTEHSSCELILIWDRNFNNIAHTQVSGKVELHANSYLTVINNQELVCYSIQKSQSPN